MNVFESENISRISSKLVNNPHGGNLTNNDIDFLEFIHNHFVDRSSTYDILGEMLFIEFDFDDRYGEQYIIKNEPKLIYPNPMFPDYCEYEQEDEQ